MPKFLKIIASWVYGTGVTIRNKMYDRGLFASEEVGGVATIVLGNITVGGTGKTPHSEYLIEILKKEFKIALLSRGYKRKTKGFRYVETTSTASEVGDEPLQIKRNFPDIIVAVDADRVRGVKYIKEKYPEVDVVVLDDAFQHRHLKPSLSILLCDYWRPMNRDKMLPLGNLRDTLDQKSRADIVFITKCPREAKPIDIRIMSHELDLMPYQQMFFSTYEYGALTPIYGDYKPNKTSKIGSVAGIANPKLFKEYIVDNFGNPDMLQYPDHHSFSQKDFNNICKLIDENDILITTEKDSMRLLQYQNFSEEQKSKMFYLPVKVKLLNHEDDKFIKFITDYVRKNKINNSFHTK